VRYFVAALISGAALATVATSNASAAPRTVIVNYCGKVSYQPSTFVVACGDAGYQLRGLHWRHWGDRVSTATGWAAINDCNPYCAAGTFHRYRIRLRASKRAECGATRAYKNVGITFTRGVPSGGAPTRLQLRCP
jgi:hypothetical protein